MRKGFFPILLLCLIMSVNGFSQDYFPLKIGNRFVYLYQWSSSVHGGGSSGGEKLQVMRITDTTTINGKKYYNCSGIPTIVSGWVRVDTNTKSLYKYDLSNSCVFYYKEILVDSLGMINPGVENSCNNFGFEGISADSLFAFYCNQVHFSHLILMNNLPSGEHHRYYNKKFGFKYYSWNYSSTSTSASEHYTLKGCIIDGIMYGDTTGITIGISPINTENPSSFSLSQNIPNPFNPITNIKFSIINSGDVKFVVYDIQGREIQTLVNERLQPGSYEVTFDGSQLSSGVYFYKLISGNYTFTKKMVLLK